MRRKEKTFFFIILVIFLIFGGINSQSQLGEREKSIISISSALSMSFSTFLGGSLMDWGYSIATSPNGNCYVMGETNSNDFPTMNAFNSTLSDGSDLFISKFSSNGSLLWSTYFGGNSLDFGASISVDNNGSCYVVGSTYSSNFPTKNAYDNTLDGEIDTFIVKLSAEGLLLWSTFLGGNSTDDGFGMAVDSSDNCYVTGFTNSKNFPTKNAFDDSFNGGIYDTFIAKFASNGALIWSTFLGGSDGDYESLIAVSAEGNCYVTGRTTSSDFPTKNAYDSTFNSGNDIFVSKFSTNCSLLWSTYLGGSYSGEYSSSITLSSDGSCYITGATSSRDFPILNAYDDKLNGYDAFVTKFSSSGSLLWSTFLGGNNGDEGKGIAINFDGDCYIIGDTQSIDFPIKNAYKSTFGGGFYGDAFITKFAADGFLCWSTFIGGNETDQGRDICISNDSSCYIIGDTYSNNFPTLNAYDNTTNGSSDAFVAKFIESEDEFGPNISAVMHNPAKPKKEDNITINCIATDNSWIQTVKLYYQINNISWLNKEMQKGVGENYSTKIGPLIPGDDVKYYIVAVDDSPKHNIALNDNNGDFYKFSISPVTNRRAAYIFLGITAIIIPIIIIFIIINSRK